MTGSPPAKKAKSTQIHPEDTHYRLTHVNILGQSFLLERSLFAKTPVKIGLRMMKQPTRRVCINRTGERGFVMCTVRGASTKEHPENAVALYCYDRERNNKRIEPSAIFQMAGNDNPVLNAKILESHKIQLDSLLFIVSLNHDEMLFVIEKSNMLAVTFSNINDLVITAALCDRIESGN